LAPRPCRPRQRLLPSTATSTVAKRAPRAASPALPFRQSCLCLSSLVFPLAGRYHPDPDVRARKPSGNTRATLACREPGAEPTAPGGRAPPPRIAFSAEPREVALQPIPRRSRSLDPHRPHRGVKNNSEQPVGPDLDRSAAFAPVGPARRRLGPASAVDGPARGPSRPSDGGPAPISSSRRLSRSGNQVSRRGPSEGSRPRAPGETKGKGSARASRRSAHVLVLRPGGHRASIRRANPEGCPPSLFSAGRTRV